MRTYLIHLACCYLFISTQPLRADLIINSSGGQTIFSSELNSMSLGDFLDDVVERRNIGLSDFQLFGQPVSQMWVSDNGQMNTSGQAFFFPHRLSSVNTNMIAPLWDDGLLFKLPDGYSPGNRIVEHVLPDVWYRVTWENVRLHLETVAGQPLPSTQRTSQATLRGSRASFELAISTSDNSCLQAEERKGSQ